MTAPTPHPTARERSIRVDDVDLHVVEAGEGPPVVLVHGFPEVSYSWRHQLPALADAGYHAIAPDMRGYGRSSRPATVTDYDIEHLTGDLVGLLDALGHDTAAFVGHDWGSMVVGSLARMHPGRVAAVVPMSVPLLPRGPMPPIQAMRMVFADAFFYMVYFQEPGVADADLGADARTTMRRMLAGLMPRDGAGLDAASMSAADGRGFVERLPEPAELPSWLSQEELDHYAEEFARTGFTGGINWYRNLDRNWEITPHLDGAKITAPSLFIGGTLDPVLMMTPVEIQDEIATDHRGNVLVEGAGHWVQQEAPGPVNDALLQFLSDVDPGGR
ncbi:MAG: alpha/beta fold hydrolase [Microthrixaceae bacterium]